MPPFKFVLWEVDVQADFMLPDGNLYVPGAEKLLPRLAHLNRAGKVISTTDAHTETDPEFKLWPHHCIVGTVGQTKPCTLLREKRIVIPNRPVDVALDGADQIIIEKQHFNLFTNPNTEASSTAANTLSTLCCVRATSTTDPSPPPPINSPTIAPITASPEATRNPVRICGKAAGKRSLNSVTAGDAPYS